MNQKVVFPFASAPALHAACRILAERGIKIAEKPTLETTHLLLPVPSFEADGTVRGGGSLEEILKVLPHSVTVLGGNLVHPLLDGYSRMDLLQDQRYLAENAALTAEGAVRLAAAQLPVCFQGCPILIIGWGRIGKCLAQLLRDMGAEIWVAVRKEQDLAILSALGYKCLFISQIHKMIAHWEVIFNTAPTLILTEEELSVCAKNCVKIDLASRRGLEGADVIWARGIPGKMLPESSGRLIAEGVIRILREEEELS